MEIIEDYEILDTEDEAEIYELLRLQLKQIKLEREITNKKRKLTDKNLPSLSKAFFLEKEVAACLE